MAQQICHDFINGVLDEFLFEISLHDDQKEVFSDAFGRFLIDETGKANIIVYEKQVGPTRWGRYQPSGRLQVKALTHSGWLLRGDVQWASLDKLHCRSMLGEWLIRCPKISFLHGLGNKCNGSSMRALIDPVPESIYLTSSPFEDKSTRRVATDWLEVNTKQGIKFLLGKGNERASELVVASLCSGSELHTIASSFLDSLSLMLGRQIRFLATDMISDEDCICTFFPMNTERRRIPSRYPLLMPDIVYFPSLFLKVATEYFLENRNSALMSYAALFQDSQIISWASSCLHVTTGVEGLRDLILAEPGSKIALKQREKEQRSRLKRHRELRAKIVELIPSGTQDGDDALLARLKSEIEHIQMDSPRELLMFACDLKQARILPEEAENWRLLRNFVAHGAELDASDPKANMQFYDSLAIFYRLACVIVGWPGDMIEYSGTVLSRIRFSEESRARATLQREDIEREAFFLSTRHPDQEAEINWLQAEELLVRRKLQPQSAGSSAYTAPALSRAALAEIRANAAQASESQKCDDPSPGASDS